MLATLRRAPRPNLYRYFSTTTLETFPAPIPPSSVESLVRLQYRSGKFHSLLCTTISNPSALLAAALRLSSSPTSESTIVRRLSLLPLSDSLRSNSFDVESHCVRLIPSRLKGSSLVLPDLELKVLIESLRLVLDAIYAPRLATFAYSGRHTALRYLKSTTKNPTWWFRVAIPRQRFGHRHVSRLTSVIKNKVEDPPLIELLEKLFSSEAVGFELGGVELGRGLPQESSLVSILINIYFDALDREMQELRADVHRKNPRLRNLDGHNSSKVFHNPIRVHAVRYLDEILVVTSGSKLFTMNVKDKILKCLEDVLELKVDRLRSSIHSAVSEKMDFLGFELQAVPPSVLNPPMSEKAIRARKKYLKRKAAKAVELKNARETIRKKLGLKILNHVFKKLKRGDGFKFDFRIEREVKEIFASWAENVVGEFFASREECWSWHRMLTRGNFLELKNVRDQLPAELVESYDRFQEKVDKYMMPVRASKVIEQEERQEEEEEEMKYTKSTVEDLTELKMKVNAPMELVRRAVKLAGFTNPMGRPQPIKLLICLDDADIIKWYAGVGRRWLEFFCCCRNFKIVKTVVNYHLRFSCILTLAEKHESTKRQAMRHYTKDLKITEGNGAEVISFITEREIRMMGDRNLCDPKPVDGTLGMILVRLAVEETSHPCLAHFCDVTYTVLYRVRLLQNRLNVDPLNEDKWVPGMGAIHESLNKKCLSLCSEHASELFLGRISLQDIDCTSFVNVG